MNPVLSTVSNSRHWLLSKPYAAIDTEFKINYENKLKPFTIFAACIVDNIGFAQFRHISDFHGSWPEKELVKWLMDEMLKFRLTIGWYSKGVQLEREDGTIEGKDSDLRVIDSVCKYYDIPSIVDFNMIGIPYVKGYDYEICKTDEAYSLLNKFRSYYHIDLYQVYKKPLVKSIIHNNKYKSLGLDAVCKAILGEGKLEGLDGTQIQTLSKEKQLEYVTQDARLVMKLSQNKNYEILDLMNAISTIINVNFERVCHTGISTWWTKIIQDKIANGTCRVPTNQVKKRRYAGGYVIEPKIGFYNKQSVYVLDVKSLYPSMMISNNISFDTVNCDCCKGNPEAMVDQNVMDIINSTLKGEEKREQYWICKKSDYRGIIPRLLEKFRDERFRQQELGNEPMQLALKNLINGCYGIFGSNFFEFADYRVAELTTAFGRYALQHMQHIAKEVYDFNIVYGDTDSIFVTNINKENDVMKFIAECSILLDIEVEIADTYRKFLITKKKHYIGIPTNENNNPIIKGMEGIKTDRPPWINKIERQIADDIKDDKEPTINIRNQYNLMESGRVPLMDLEIKMTLTKSPEDYPANRLQRVVGSELEANQGDIIPYYKSDVKGGGTSNPDLISRRKYLEMLRTTVEDALKLMGYDFVRDILGHKKLEHYNSCNKQTDSGKIASALKVHVESVYSKLKCRNTKKDVLDVRTLIKCKTNKDGNYTCVYCTPAKGVLFITDENPSFISGQVRMRGKDGGSYPYNYLEMIDSIFGFEQNTIEVCSRSVPGIKNGGTCFTVDINSQCNPDLLTDGQILKEIPDNKFSRLRCDPPYSERAAKEMYGTSLPNTSKLLKAGARVCKPGSLMFFLLGKNYQPCPPSVKRIAMISISVIPNNETRILNIYYKIK